jgi:hypothetical protein
MKEIHFMKKAEDYQDIKADDDDLPELVDDDSSDNENEFKLPSSGWGGTVRLDMWLIVPVSSNKPPKFNKPIQPMQVVVADGRGRLGQNKQIKEKPNHLEGEVIGNASVKSISIFQPSEYDKPFELLSLDQLEERLKKTKEEAARLKRALDAIRKEEQESLLKFGHAFIHKGINPPKEEDLKRLDEEVKALEQLINEKITNKLEVTFN